MLKSHYLLSLELLKDQIVDNTQYPFNLPVIQGIEKLHFHPKVTFLIGENGSGKSTLTEAIATAYGFNPEGGSKNFNFATSDTHSVLHDYIKLTKGYKHPKDGYFLRAETYYNLATNIDKLDTGGGGRPIKDSYGGKSLHHQSHGESFFSLFMNRLGGHGLYIFDEPEAALSPARQLQFLQRIHQLVQQDSQFIIATHSPIILSYPEAQIREIKNGSLQHTPYQQTQHYQTYYNFLLQPNQQLYDLGIIDL